MDLLSKLSQLSDGKEYISTDNFYYTHHNCSKTGKTEKVMLNYTLSTDLSDNILKLGKCEHCNNCFYHNDYMSKSF